MSEERLLLANHIWPEEELPYTAATLVNYKIIFELASRPDIKVGFLKINVDGYYHHKTAPMNSIQKKAKANLEALGVEYLPAVELPSLPKRRLNLSRWFRPKLVDYYPAITYRQEVYKVADTFRPSCLIIIWCEWLTHLFADYSVKKFTYYGNPDPLTDKIFSKYIQPRGVAKQIYGRLWNYRLERFHVEEMNKWNFVGNVHLHFSKYYQSKLGSKAFYLNNIWIDRYGGDWEIKRDLLESKDKLRIVGNIGHLTGTANTLGLEILLRDLLPELRGLLPAGSFEIDIYGRNEPTPRIRSLLNQPEIKVRGFVDDLDTEMLGSQIFLCVNNASHYNTGHTRYLHAWSLGCCVVAHCNVTLAMPELKHRYNSLLGKNVREIAELIAMARSDPQLRQRLGRNGYKTLKENFRVENVVDTMLEKLSSI